jgi:hypothetical protein
LAKRKEGSRVEPMTPQEKKTSTESIALFKQTLEGNNYSPQSIKAYMGDLEPVAKLFPHLPATV